VTQVKKAAYCFPVVLPINASNLCQQLEARRSASCKPNPVPCLFLYDLGVKNGLYIFLSGGKIFQIIFCDSGKLYEIHISVSINKV
jgi:hypothetical protein